MKKRLCRKGLCGWLALSMVTTGMGGMTVLHAEEVQAEEAAAVTADIYPKPQSETYLSEEGISLNTEVNIVLHGDQEEASLPKLQEALQENGYFYSVGEYDASKSNIIVSSSREHCDECLETESEALNHAEGYVLTSSDDENANGDVTIIGSDADGAYYGIMTLRQMLEQKSADDRIAEVTIEDYPEIEFRGYIEGFYGYPWTHEERMSLMEDTAKYKMNTYIYAPKDDPYHRTNWKELYPDVQAQQIAELAQAGHENNFNFCWTIHPGATLQFNDTDFNALIKKYEQLYDLGVRQFGVLFDDTNDWYNGAAQVAFINRIDDEFVKEKGDVKPLIVVAARYNAAWGPSASYFTPYMRDLHEDIQIMWTGAATMSNISREVYEWPKTWTGVDRDLAVWWNYPVNDYCDGKLVMAPLHNLNPDLDNVTGFFSNPMQQADASKVALFSIADYTWNTDSFEYMDSWERAIEELVPEASDAFKHFAEDTSYLKDDGGTSGEFLYNESWNSVGLIDNLNAAITEGTDISEPAQALMDKFIQIQEDAAALAEIENVNLAEEINEHREAYASLGVAGENAILALLAATDGDLSGWVEYNAAAQEALSDSNNHIIVSLEDSGTKQSVAEVGTQYLKPAVTNILNAAETRIGESAFEQFETEVTDADGTVDCSVSQDQGKYTITDAAAVLDPGEAVQIALPKAMQISSIIMEADVTEGLAMETSLNGLEWTAAETAVEDGAMVMDTQTAAAFIRIVNTTDEVLELNISSLAVSPVYKATPSISTSMGTYQDYSIDKALDGSMDTKFWSNAAPSAGSYIQVDLGKVMPLYDIKGYFDMTDSFNNGKVEISQDGIQWTEVGAIAYETVNGKYVTTNNAEGAMARYFRFTNNASQTSWIQLFEVEFNTTVATGDDMVIVTEASNGEDHVYAADGDLSTAYAPETVEDGDYLIYHTTRITNIGVLRILQSGDAVCNAAVSIRTAGSDEWKEIGILDAALTEIEINDTVLEVKLTFHEGNPAPVIYEIIPSAGTEKPEEPDKEISTAVLEYAIELAKDTDTDGVIDAVKENFEKALQNAQDILARVQSGDKAVTQNQVDDAWRSLIKAMQYMEFKEADKSDLAKVIALAEEMNGNLDAYLDEGKPAFTAALADAKEVYADELASQEEVTGAWQKLLDAIVNMMLKPDKGLLEDLISQAEGLNAADYEAESFSAMRSALVDAKDVFANENATEEEVATSVAALEEALAKLTPVSTGGEQQSGDAGSSQSGAGNSTQGQAGGTGDKDNTPSSKTSGAKAVNTGDAAGVLPFAAAAAMAAAAGAAVLLKKKEEN